MSRVRELALVLALPAALALAGATLGMRHGIGLTPDAVVYLDTASHLARGEGFVQDDVCRGGALTPVTHFPPLYPWVLSRGVRAGLSAEGGARVLQVILFAANVALVGGLVLLRTASRRAAFLASLFAASALGMLEAHTAAWSEPLFLALVQAGLIATIAALERARRGRPAPLALGLSALALGTAAITRYVGGAVVVAVAIAHVILSGDALRWRARLGRATAFAALALAPLGAFVVRNTLAVGHTTDRAAGWHPVGLSHLTSLARTIGAWVLPGADRLPQLRVFDVVVVFAGVGLAIAVARAGRGRTADLAVSLHKLVAATYLALLFVSMSAFDRGTPPDQRNLILVFQCGLVILMIDAPTATWPRRLNDPRLKRAVAVALGAAYFASFALATRYLWRNGRGYLAPGWSYPRLYERIATLPSGGVLLSNVPEAAHLRTGRPACALPARADAVAPRTVAVLYFEEPRRFTPRVVGDTDDPGPGLAAGRAAAYARGLDHELTERNATLFTR